jgi:hypothetical protein
VRSYSPHLLEDAPVDEECRRRNCVVLLLDFKIYFYINLYVDKLFKK